MSDNKTSVKLSTSTRDELRALGSKGETYDDIVQRLIDGAQEDGV